MQRDLPALAAGLEQRTVEVAPVHDRVGCPVAGSESWPSGDAREFAVAKRVHQHQMVGVHRLQVDLSHDAEPVEHAPGVGTQLDAVADLTELRGLLEHARAQPADRERERSRDATDATASYQDLGGIVRAHVSNPYRENLPSGCPTMQQSRHRIMPRLPENRQRHVAMK